MAADKQTNVHPSFFRGSFSEAAEHGDVKRLRELLGYGVEIDFRFADCRGKTALILAAHGTHAEAVRMLIGEGADVNACDDGGITAAIVAGAMWGADEREAMRDSALSCVTALLGAGADVGRCTGMGASVLSMAVRAQRADLLHALIDNGVSVDARDARGITLLMLAAASGRVEHVVWLHQLGAALTSLDSNGWTAGHHAATEGALGVLDWLVRHGAPVPDIEWMLGVVEKNGTSPNSSGVAQCLAYVVRAGGHDPHDVMGRIRFWYSDAAKAAIPLIEAEWLANISDVQRPAKRYAAI